MAEIKRTPDKLQGAENASRAIANALNFTLQNQIQQDRNRRALEQVKAEQAAEDKRVAAKLGSDFQQLQANMEAKAAELKERRDYHQGQLEIMGRDKDAAADIDRLKSLHALENERHRFELAKARLEAENSQAAQNAKIIQELNAAFPDKQYTDLAASSLGYNETLTEQALKMAEYLRQRKGEALRKSGFPIESEYGPFRDTYRAGPPLVTGQEERGQNAFDFLGEGGRSIVQPETPEEKIKLEWPE